ncbi:MAG: hypothetical protein Q7J80_08015, partial [Anaerolineales bacterium]|nr:hypothetical protein [Anaerolineales bacterium]
VDANLPPDALIAVHDIGAMGYFDQHVLLDLAGLISPQVIPIMHDQTRLAEYFDQQGVDYLIVFPTTYPELVAESTLVYAAPEVLTVPMGAGNLSVYFWK